MRQSREQKTKTGKTMNMTAVYLKGFTHRNRKNKHINAPNEYIH